MLLRVTADTDAQPLARLHPPDGADQFLGVGISSGNRREPFLSFEGIAPERHHVVDAHEMEVLHQPLDFGGGIACTDDVGNHLDVVTSLDAAADGDGGDAAADQPPAEGSVGLGNVLDFVPMRRDVDVAGLELHQGSDAFQQLILGDPAQGRNDFQGREGMAGIQEVGDSHSRWERKACASSGEKPRAAV